MQTQKEIINELKEVKKEWQNLNNLVHETKFEGTVLEQRKKRAKFVRGKRQYYKLKIFMLIDKLEEP